MGKLNMKEWISQTIQRKETIAIPIMFRNGMRANCVAILLKLLLIACSIKISRAVI